MEELQKILPCLVSTGKLVYSSNSSAALLKLLEAYSQILSNAVFMRGTLNKFESFGKSAEEILEKDKNFGVLSLLTRARKNHEKAKVQILSLIPTIPGVAAESQLSQLLNLEVPMQFQMLEADSHKMFDDLIGYQISKFTETLKELATEMVKSVNAFHCHGEAPWGASLAHDAAFDEIYTAAQTSILRLNPSFRKLPDDFLKARWSGHGVDQPALTNSVLFKPFFGKLIGRSMIGHVRSTYQARVFRL